MKIHNGELAKKAPSFTF